MDLPACERHTLRQAASLHDIGKIGIPAVILLKPGKLSFDELVVMHEHPSIGATIVSVVLPEIQPIILAHHEQPDGLGYPLKLRSDAILLPSGIIAVCDSYDAMTEDRPYRKGMQPSYAAKILCEGAGGQWDAMLVEVFLSILTKSEIISDIETKCLRQFPANSRV